MDDRDMVVNYYKKMVLSQLEDEPAIQEKGDADYLADVACVALNKLPPRYIRHPIDASFYITPTEHQQMELAVQKAISDAISFVNERQNQSPDGSGGKIKT